LSNPATDSVVQPLRLIEHKFAAHEIDVVVRGGVRLHVEVEKRHIARSC